MKLLYLAIILLIAPFAFLEAQETETQEPAATSAPPAEEPEASDEPINDAQLDDERYTGSDDDFRPTEEIPADQSIAFPTDI